MSWYWFFKVKKKNNKNRTGKRRVSLSKQSGNGGRTLGGLKGYSCGKVISRKRHASVIGEVAGPIIVETHS